ncbi:hypothetical protein KUV62_07600 [Salipiger bermudensis]|uniref:hypothetical protein n=1 Tax=Salipiger bermudensis TaxID=344736 RepID=UPI001C9920EE|nr:hypothetical protein [Salipiger bermudensis]MBY6003766.1 hypothetical protein [Salipiger bermudensis]
MTTDFLALARDRRIEALTARSLSLCRRRSRPARRACVRIFRWLGLACRPAIPAPRTPAFSLALSGAAGRVSFPRRLD